MRKFSAKDKVKIYQAYLRCRNKLKVSREFKIDRSYLYEIISECESALLDHFDQKEPGRKKADMPGDYAEAVEKIKELQAQNLQLDKAREELYIRNEWLQLRLSWAEKDDENRQLKKTKNKML